LKSAVILISGRGSNMRALVEAGLPLEVRAVISNRADAPGLAWANERGLQTRVVEHKAFATREAFDTALARTIDGFVPDLILLAGFMRILSDEFINRFPRRILNIHPSLLPSFPGLHTHARALAAGVKVHGATVHVVTPALDAGPIVVQAAVPVLPAMTSPGSPTASSRSSTAFIPRRCAGSRRSGSSSPTAISSACAGRASHPTG
jgi:phosphoribosylglycinamide formyltransferase-1